MTVKEKRQALKNYCKEKSCFNCPLDNLTGGCYDTATDDIVGRNYALIFGNDSEEQNVPVEDPVNRPAHYTDGKIEVIDYIEDKKLGFCLGNAIKYISRAGKKDPTKEVEDLNKAKWYIERRIKEIQEAK